MNDKELADAVVALGVGYSEPHNIITTAGDYWLHQSEEQQNLRRMSAFGFVTDWRVAGALMERIDGELLIWLQKYSGRTDVWIVEPEKQDADARNESLPRAIIEACVEALK